MPDKKLTPMMELTAEQFLREKLQSEIESFGDGTTEFHTRDINHLLRCLSDKDEKITIINARIDELISRINFNVEKQFEELLTLVMTINNMSAEERLYYIRKTYKETWTKVKNTQTYKS